MFKRNRDGMKLPERLALRIEASFREYQAAELAMQAAQAAYAAAESRKNVLARNVNDEVEAVCKAMGVSADKYEIMTVAGGGYELRRKPPEAPNASGPTKVA